MEEMAEQNKHLRKPTVSQHCAAKQFWWTQQHLSLCATW